MIFCTHNIHSQKKGRIPLDVASAQGHSDCLEHLLERERYVRTTSSSSIGLKLIFCKNLFYYSLLVLYCIHVDIIKSKIFFL